MASSEINGRGVASGTPPSIVFQEPYKYRLPQMYINQFTHTQYYGGKQKKIIIPFATMCSLALISIITFAYS